MDANEIRFTVKILKSHYELGMSQVEIAKQEHLSKSKVNRIIKKSLLDGYIKLTINYPITSVQELEDEFKRIFGLKKAFFAPVIVNDEELIKKDVSRALGMELANIVDDDDIIGISWGNTMNSVASCLPKMNKNGVKIVQLNGGVSKNVKPTRTMNIIELFSDAFNGVSYILPMPAIVDNSSTVGVLKNDSQINYVFNLIEKSRIAIFSIGYLSFKSVLYSAKYFTKEEYVKLQQNGAVGDICSRYFNLDGKVVDEMLDARTIGVSLDVLKQKDYSIAVVVGEKKANAILGALNGGYINTLFSDENTAKKVLKLYHHNKDNLIK